MRVMLVALLIGYSTAARATYEGTGWGTSSDKVEKTYPGGSYVDWQAGYGYYRVVQRIDRSVTVIKTFLFQGDELQSVGMQVCAPKQHVNVYGSPVLDLTAAQERNAWRVLVKYLTAKYGVPNERSTSVHTWWDTAEGDTVWVYTWQPQGAAGWRMVVGWMSKTPSRFTLVLQ